MTDDRYVITNGKRRITPQDEITYGIVCRKCKKAKAIFFCYSDMNILTMVTFKCTKCGQLSDILFQTKNIKEYLPDASSRT